MAHFLTPLIVEYTDGRVWRVADAFDYHVGSSDSPLTVVVPVGTLTDFASIPRLLWPLLPPTGRYGKAAVLHDWLYQTGEFTRATSDAILLEAMGVLGVPWWTRWVIYTGVRVGGWLAWHDHRSEESYDPPPDSHDPFHDLF